jgi:hypothetical protein
MECWPALVRLLFEPMPMVYYQNKNFQSLAFDEIGLGRGIMGLAEGDLSSIGVAGFGN